MTKHEYTFTSSDGKTVTVLRGTMPPKMTGGGGGWEIIPRPRRVALTQWTGRQPYQMEVPVMIDGRMTDSVEGDIAKLNQMQMGGDLKQPPTVRVAGAVPVKGIRWVIAGIDWGDNVVWNQRGAANPVRLRQDAVVRLIQYNPEDRLVTRRKSTTQALKPRRHTVKQGETLRTIAKKYYNDAERWRTIASANGIRDPYKIKVGQSLRIP